MTRDTDPRAVDRPRITVLLLFLLGLGLAVAATRPAPVRAEGGGALVAEPVLAASAAGVTELFGASPAEAPGRLGSGDEIGWEAGPRPLLRRGRLGISRGTD